MDLQIYLPYKTLLTTGTTPNKAEYAWYPQMDYHYYTETLSLNIEKLHTRGKKVQSSLKIFFSSKLTSTRSTETPRKQNIQSVTNNRLQHNAVNKSSPKRSQSKYVQKMLKIRKILPSTTKTFMTNNYTTQDIQTQIPQTPMKSVLPSHSSIKTQSNNTGSTISKIVKKIER